MGAKAKSLKKVNSILSKDALHLMLTDKDKNRVKVSVDDFIAIYGDDRSHHQLVSLTRADILASSYNMTVKFKNNHYIFKRK